MRQVLQNLKTGITELADVPSPLCCTGHLLIATRCSLISSGTERMLVEFSEANLLAKARSQPDRVRQVLDKIRTDGLLPTLEAVRHKLDQPIPMGYCNAGVVLEVGDGVDGFAVGDRVASNGPHAEIVSVPRNLCAKIPDEVSDDEAAFTVPAAIALQGIRLVNPTLGEHIVVTGLGLLGLLAVQMLVAAGCQVLGIDYDRGRLALARRFGAQTVDLSAGEDPVVAGMTFSKGKGVDAVLITAATKSDEPVQQAAQMSRKRGRIVLVGVAGLNLRRADFYEKELTFQVSCSYGPGRYDEEYEQKGHDYPYGFVRWTEQRNFEAVLGLMAQKKLDVMPLISERIPQARAPEAYHKLTDDHSSLGLLLTYPELDRDIRFTVSVSKAGETHGAQWEDRRITATSCVIGVIGAGNFASAVLLPALKKTPALLKTVASGNDPTSAIAARKLGFQQATTDYRVVLEDTEIKAVFIATRHNAHAHMVIDALRAGKHVFVEKPLGLNRQELVEVKGAFEEAGSLHLMVGFNRRFSPLAAKMKRLLSGRCQPLSVVYTVNAGEIPADHWTQDPAVGGGRIIGEACHFIDFLRFLVGYPITGVEARMMGASPGVRVREDKMTVVLDFADGSVGTVHYFANGSKKYPKERVEVFSQGRVLVLDNFKSLRGFGCPGFRKMHLLRQDKGHEREVAAFVKRLSQGGNPLIPWTEIEEVTLATFAAVERAKQHSGGVVRTADSGDLA